jgi:hypothetical protein
MPSWCESIAILQNRLISMNYRRYSINLGTFVVGYVGAYLLLSELVAIEALTLAPQWLSQRRWGVGLLVGSLFVVGATGWAWVRRYAMAMMIAAFMASTVVMNIAWIRHTPRYITLPPGDLRFMASLGRIGPGRPGIVFHAVAETYLLRDLVMHSDLNDRILGIVGRFGIYLKFDQNFPIYLSDEQFARLDHSGLAYDTYMHNDREYRLYDGADEQTIVLIQHDTTFIFMPQQLFEEIRR